MRYQGRLAAATVALLALCGGSLACGSDAGSTTTPPSRSGLRWAPPTLDDPATIRLGGGFTETVMDPTKDYIVKLPKRKKVGGTVLIGGHDVVISGGAITIPKGTSTDTERRAIYIKEATGTVRIEGVSIDGSGGAPFDGVDVAAPRATVQLENDRIVGVRGGMNGFHGDIVQTWGGVKDLEIDHLTGRSDYQGLTIREELGRIGSAQLSNVDITATPSPEPPALAGGYMLWLTSGNDTCDAFPITLSNVFITPRHGRPLATSVWPPPTAGLGCGAQVSGTATWPRLPVQGKVRRGPPTRSFVPAASVGLGYAPAS